MKQLINYKETKNTKEGFTIVVPFYDREVLVDLPIAIIDFGIEYDNPVILGALKGIPTIVELEHAVEYKKNFKTFYLAEDSETGVLTETTAEDANYVYDLPISTDVSELRMVNNRLTKYIKAEESEN